MTARIGWVVDAQVDFMDPAGRLYVKDLADDGDVGSVQIVDRLRDTVAWMREHCAAVVYTGDWHALSDAEIDAANPDPAAGTYPPHCMGRSPDLAERAGAEIIAPIRPAAPVVLPVDADAAAGRAAAVEVLETASTSSSGMRVPRPSSPSSRSDWVGTSRSWSPGWRATCASPRQWMA